VRERTPSPDSPAVHRWRHVAEQLGPEEPPAAP
jgi:hypothetical protein